MQGVEAFDVARDSHGDGPYFVGYGEQLNLFHQIFDCGIVLAFEPQADHCAAALELKKPRGDDQRP